LADTFGDSLVDFEILAMRQGSLIVDGRILTKEELTDVASVAAKLEESITGIGSQLGGNSVDVKAITIDGILSKGVSAEFSKDSGQLAATNTGYIVAGAIGIGALIVIFAIFAIVVFGINNRRSSSRTLKLREEINMVETGRPYARTSTDVVLNGNDGVNL